MPPVRDDAAITEHVERTRHDDVLAFSPRELV